jgi:glycogen debranching enzyme
MEWVRAVLEYTDHTGDQTLLHEVFDNIEMLHRWFLRQRNEAGLMTTSTPPVQVWMDSPYSRLCNWRNRSAWERELPFLPCNLRYLLFLDDMADCFRRMGRTEMLAPLAHDRKKLAAAILQTFRDPETGLLYDVPRDCTGPDKTFSDMAHALAICANLFSARESEQLWDKFKQISRERPADIISASPFGKYHVHQALARMGRREELLQDILTHWGPMVDAGSVTTWESFAGDTSHCHAWAAIPIPALVGSILGLSPNKTGTARREKCGTVAWMEATLA